PVHRQRSTATQCQTVAQEQDASIDGNPASAGNGSTFGFACDSPEKVHAWHEAGLAHGGEAIEDPPGVREGPAGKLYLAYLRDPDGNKICALFRMPAA
ncbi:MAG: hypothetical protein EBV84_01420, partial [Betaproteobacteria bacterium]|nr:hypothetical protein [Betaproteobacteria bacterium]